ncbi:helix-turn-helix domain-containing protein [Microbacterium gubbeenense]|uniref:helix-turn-helix domain-containing protein n=1 Tax=Microbacterium gubbeenense TaxID=159896 RepID=UPI003F988AB1
MHDHTPTGTARRLLTREEIADYLNATPRTVRAIIERREVPTVKIGRRVLVDVRDLDAYILANTRPANGDAR